MFKLQIASVAFKNYYVFKMLDSVILPAYNIIPTTSLLTHHLLETPRTRHLPQGDPGPPWRQSLSRWSFSTTSEIRGLRGNRIGIPVQLCISDQESHIA